MEFTYQCDACGHVYGVSKLDESLHLLSPSMNCPRSVDRLDHPAYGKSCPGHIEVVTLDITEQMIYQQVSAQDLFLATRGRGFPPERKCSPEALREALLGGTVVALDLDECDSDEDRSMIHRLAVENGTGIMTTIHFAMSIQGATIFKITQG